MSVQLPRALFLYIQRYRVIPVALFISMDSRKEVTLDYTT
jgi:hypothetical protein